MRGNILRDSIISASNHIFNQKQMVDELNVFPVPDGDTGTNMSMTMSAAQKAMMLLPDDVSVEEVANTVASALLRGARGNSGVILSLIFRGFSKALVDKVSCDGRDFAQALTQGVKAAYKAVMKPTEGTILTVARLAGEKAVEVSGTNPDLQVVLEETIVAAQIALENTPELLPVLKKAGVVDAGGKGFVLILEGMASVIIHGISISGGGEISAPVKKEVKGHLDPDMVNGYCTEFIVNKNKGFDTVNTVKFRAFLESMGDSVVVVEDDEIIKVHLHTDNPGKALTKATDYGYLTNMKIENMIEQYNQRLEGTQPESAPEEKDSFSYVPVSNANEFGFVAVSAGQGIHNLFVELGVGAVVTGGQTMNPSTEDILQAIHAVDAKTVFVLPNNKNIIMAAEQSVEYADRKVIVLQTTTIPQGISALLNFDADLSLTENTANMATAINGVSTGLITYAARDSDFDGHKIKEGQILALNGGKLAFTEKSLEKAVIRLTKQLVTKDSAFVTLISGSDVMTEKAEEMKEKVVAKLPRHLEVSYLHGGQPVYYFIISVE